MPCDRLSCGMTHSWVVWLTVMPCDRLSCGATHSYLVWMTCGLTGCSVKQLTFLWSDWLSCCPMVQPTVIPCDGKSKCMGLIIKYCHFFWRLDLSGVRIQWVVAKAGLWFRNWCILFITKPVSVTLKSLELQGRIIFECLLLYMSHHCGWLNLKCLFIYQNGSRSSEPCLWKRSSLGYKNMWYEYIKVFLTFRSFHHSNFNKSKLLTFWNEWKQGWEILSISWYIKSHDRTFSGEHFSGTFLACHDVLR